MSSWLHYVCDGKAGTRDEAIEAMFAYYDSHPGKRRKKARDAFEVYRATRNPAGWILFVRTKSRRRSA